MLELLVVIAILGVFAAILFSTLTGAIRRSKVTASHLTLRNEGMAIFLYATEDDNALPAYDALRGNLRLDDYRSPRDSWRTPLGQRTRPMLGSYAYGPSLAKEIAPAQIRWAQPSPMLADVFSADYHLAEFAGDEPSDFATCSVAHTCEIPEQVAFFFTDGSLKVRHYPRPPTSASLNPNQRALFTWSYIFSREISP